MLQEVFISLLNRNTDNEHLKNELWVEIQHHYSSPNRHYHTLHHLENLLTQMMDIKSEIQHWDTILFTLYYHDIIYNATSSNNEEKSAEFAKKRMIPLHISTESINNSMSQILATKSHQQSLDNDTNYFTDADLSILGQDWETYSQYYQNVRKEYAIYPDFIYNPGRKKVLNHFLSMQRIYKTDFFHHKFEIQAKENLRNELKLL